MIPQIDEDNEDVYKLFYEKNGCVIIKNVFSHETMSKYNEFCHENFDDVLENHKNCSHPKQSDKITINDLLERLSSQNPKLLCELINNTKLNNVIDKLLGFGVIGSMSCHNILPGGNRQKTHVDYPLHIGSGKFWENNKELIDEYLTDYQINNILPFFSVQCLIASDSMGEFNGSTEVIVGSHLIKDIDKKVLDKDFCSLIEKYFVNVTLNKGDVLLFNRSLVHRGGYNKSQYNRNSCIIQYCWLFGIGQAVKDHKYILNNLEKEINKLSTDNKKKIKYRIKPPYPVDVTVNN